MPFSAHEPSTDSTPQMHASCATRGTSACVTPVSSRFSRSFSNTAHQFGHSRAAARRGSPSREFTRLGSSPGPPLCANDAHAARAYDPRAGAHDVASRRARVLRPDAYRTSLPYLHRARRSPFRLRVQDSRARVPAVPLRGNNVSHRNRADTAHRESRTHAKTPFHRPARPTRLLEHRPDSLTYVTAASHALR